MQWIIFIKRYHETVRKDTIQAQPQQIPYFDYQKLAARTSGVDGSYTLSLSGSNNGVDLVYYDFVDSELKKISE
jgi:hypothetical protein